MANSFKKLSPNWIAREVLFRVAAQSAVAGSINRRYSSEYTNRVPRLGETIRVRRPTILRTVNGPDITGQIQDMTENSVDITMDQYISVPVELTDLEHALTLSPEEARAEFVPAMADALVNELDNRLASFAATAFPNVVGVAGTTPADYDTIAAAGEVLDRFGAPRTDRHFIMDPRANRFLANAFHTKFNPEAQQSETFREGLIGRTAGFDGYMDRNIAPHTDQAVTGTARVNGGSQTGTSLVMTMGVATEGYNKGAVIEIDGVNAVDPLTGNDTGVKKQFVVEATANAVAGALTITIFPGIVTSGPYKTVTASPANLANVVLKSAGASQASPVLGRQNLAIHRDAMGMVSVPLPLFRGLDIAERVSYMGYSLRLMRDVDIKTATAVARMDMLFGRARFYGEMGARVLG